MAYQYSFSGWLPPLQPVLGFQTSVQGTELVLATVPAFGAAPALDSLSEVTPHGQVMMLLMSVTVLVTGWIV